MTVQGPSRSERAKADTTKAGGVHYTPTELASFVAANALEYVETAGRLRVLDPACGDGALLAAVVELVPAECELELVGCDKDPAAIEAAEARLIGLGVRNTAWSLETCDFLSEAVAVRKASSSLFGGSTRQSASLAKPFDLVIANPPYVRTQTLGGEESRRLSDVFGLTGRVDLYHAFAVAMTESLREGGVLALLCSNRFMTTKGGRSLRQHLQKLDLRRVFDLGDTKLFKAAVLPAVIVASRRESAGERPSMATVYERSPSDGGRAVRSVLDALDDGIEGSVLVGTSAFEIRRGVLNLDVTSSDPWVLATDGHDWVRQVDERASLRFGDLGKIRVGIKTTADKVFIREDWSAADGEVPEADLLRPLFTHHAARRWTAGEPTRRVLYPYDLNEHKRVPLDLDEWPRAAAYLESYRTQLEGRRYVVEAGRNWWEIWVPQRPAEWALPKLIFPDISDLPRFCIDYSGSIVNGDCYWLALPTETDQSLGLLAMAVANSSLGTRFYDEVCGNKLYSGRRRYITQYVGRFPLPDPAAPEARKIVELVGNLIEDNVSEAEATDLEEEIDQLVWRSFGFEEIPG
jgi:adenine-specific DNA-methyltransferase